MIVDCLWALGKGKKLATGNWGLAVGDGENLETVVVAVRFQCFPSALRSLGEGG